MIMRRVLPQGYRECSRLQSSELRAARARRAKSTTAAKASYADYSGAYSFRAQCHPGLESVVADELSRLPAKVRNVSWKAGKAGVDFSGASMECAYHACVRLRAAIRVLHCLGTGTMDARGKGYDELYAVIQRIATWPEHVRAGMTLDVDLRMAHCSNWNNSMIAERCVRDAVSDALRAAGQEKPERPAPGSAASLTLYVSLFQDEVKVYRDVSGESLHRRGYRAGSAIHKAALNEAAAAGVLYMAGWPAAARQGKVLVDCMCGSGTILTEAALMAHNIAPGLLRNRWAHESWHDHDAARWRDALDSARAEISRDFGGVIAGNDVHEGSLVLARSAIKHLRLQDTVRLHLGNCKDWSLPRVPHMVVTNPPWGVRMPGRAAGKRSSEALEADDTSEEDLDAAWTDLRAFLKSQCAGSTAWILNGNKMASRALKMSVSQRIPITLSGVDCRLLKYDILADRDLGQGQSRAEALVH